jgi:hypothetical protein
MNKGERDEIIIQLKLIELRGQNFHVDGVGAIKSVKFLKEYNELPKGIILDRLNYSSDQELEKLANHCGIVKAGANYKADTKINYEPISLKSLNGSPPALVNHTTRPGFEFAGRHGGGKIEQLDNIIERYWDLRLTGSIGEDVHNSELTSPFYKNKEVLKPFLNYFLFKGSGAGLSRLQANRILSFSDPLKPKTWKFYDESNAVDLYWNKLVFSLRAKKGMPSGYPHNLSAKLRPHKSSIDKWVKFINADHRGALHIRSK